MMKAKNKLPITSLLSALTAILFAFTPLTTNAMDSSKPVVGEKVTMTGEVVDLMCYLDHGAKGPDHAGCAKKCIKSGGPVGLLTEDGQVYLLIGSHAPANDELALHAADTITVVGKYVERDGMKMIENIQIQ